MLSEVGTMLIGLALAVSLYAAFAALWAIRKGERSWQSSARNAIYSAAGLLGGALVLLLAAFLTNQFQVRYVAENSSRSLPLYLKVSAVWAGQDGSLLLWAFIQAMFTAVAVARPVGRAYRLLPWATVFLNVITAFFAGVTLLASNPFTPSPSPVADGMGMNPLLRHPGMIFHPPAMYLGYVGVAVPFAFALSALVTRRLEDWPSVARRWILVAWLFLGMGLLLGMRWAYDVLGWGGYWGWDPVENAGLMPWLTITALLHGVVMQEQRGGFRRWNLGLVLLSFVLVLFGTFTTRSGMIQSVHAFSNSDLGLYFLGAIVVAALFAVGLMVYRHADLGDSHPVEGLLSRDGFFLLTLMLLVTITGSVFVGSVLPTLTAVFGGQQFEAGPEWFDRVTGPQFALLVLLMGVCPLLGRASAALERLKARSWPGLLSGLLFLGLALMAGFTDPASLVGFVIIGLAGGTAVAEYVRDAASRSRRQQVAFPVALWQLFGRNRRKYGGYLVHIGVVLLGLGIIGTRMYAFETTVSLTPGESADVLGYAISYDDFVQEMVGDHVSSRATLALSRNGRHLATLCPGIDQYPAHPDQTTATPALRVGLKEDFYVVLAGWDSNGATAIFKVYVNPLAVYIWLGGLVLLLGGSVALLPETRAVRLSVSEARRRRAWQAAWATAAVLLSLAAGLAMWRPCSGTPGSSTASTGGQPTAQPTTPARASGPPRVGKPAPDFTLELLDGSTLTLSEVRGKVAVVNFWATWCPPCADELPDFQTVWEEYQDKGVVFIGIAVQDVSEKPAVEEMVSSLGLTYPLGLDMRGEIFPVYGVTGVPETLVVDGEGVVAFRHIGQVSAAMLREELDSLLGEGGGGG